MLLKIIRPLVLAAIVAFLTPGCDIRSEKYSALVEPGVSASLADLRRDLISDVSYKITLSVPSEKDSSITGHETVSFHSSSRASIPLDFTPSEDEHILLRAKKGTNSFDLDFVSDNRFLNRNEEYLYSLFVPAHARSVFPCFDQPDLKARFTLSLEVPEDWTAVSNTAATDTVLLEGGRKRIDFAQTEPVSTYLFAFVAGKWSKATSTVQGRDMNVYYRETDPDKIAQIPDIFNEVGQALTWMEDFTGIRMPFSKYDFVVVPNFQFGGMERPGSILYNERTMFLGNSPTPDERLARMKLISHETAHLWFGDLVTMRWFDEVWTKEVFANHLAAKMVEPMFPGINHELSWLKGYLALAMDEERTEGATAIRQDLPNLADAGLIYNNMVYDKAPVMMRMLEEYIGPEAFHESLKAYLARYSYSNATWDDLVDVLDAHSDKNVKSFSESWVNERRGGDMMGTLKSFSDQSKYQDIEPETIREAKILLAKEDFLAGKTTAAEYLDMLLGALEAETNPLIASTIVSAIRTPLLDLEGDRSAPEARLLKMASSHALEPCRLQLKRLLASCGTSPAVTDAVYDIWAAEKDKGLTVNDYISFACQLAIRMPEKAEEIIGIQRSRLDGSDPSRSYNKNNLDHLDFVSRVALPDIDTQDAVFEELLTPQGRVVEPWASEALGYLNHFLRESSSIKYIRPALDALLEVKATGDIFFPGNWCGALLGGHSSAQALEELDSFLEDNPDYPQLLKNKILVAAYGLQRANNVKSLN